MVASRYRQSPKGSASRKNRELRYNYGITLEDYESMFAAQHGACAICGRLQSDFKYRLSVDHNHETGTVRALLCVTCNHKIGVIEDAAFMAKARAYLTQTDEERAE